MIMRFVLAITLNFLMLSCNTGAGLLKAENGFFQVKNISISKNTILIAPQNYRPEKTRSTELDTPDYKLNLYARQFARGDVIYAEIVPVSNNLFDETPKFQVNNKNFL